RELGEKFLKDYPKSGFGAEVLLTLGRHAAEATRFEEAASDFDRVGQKLGAADATGLDGFLSAARLRLAMGRFQEPEKTLSGIEEPSGSKKSLVLPLLAEAQLKAGEYAASRATLERAVKVDKHNARAAGMLVELIATHFPQEKPEALVAMLTAVAQGPEGQS